MPTLAPTIDHALVTRCQAIAAHLTNAVVITNALAEEMLSLPNADLAAWLNTGPPEDRLAMFTAHGQLGEGLNALAALVGGMTGQSLPLVDVCSVPEKLARQRRAFEFDGATFTVTDLPATEPEPTADIQPEPDPE